MGDFMDLTKVLPKVFLWMFLGLAITFGIAYYVSTNDNMVYNLFAGKKYLIFWIIELVIVLVLSLKIRSLNPITAKIMFIACGKILLERCAVVYNQKSQATLVSDLSRLCKRIDRIKNFS